MRRKQVRWNGRKRRGSTVFQQSLPLALPQRKLLRPSRRRWRPRVHDRRRELVIDGWQLEGGVDSGLVRKICNFPSSQGSSGGGDGRNVVVGVESEAPLLLLVLLPGTLGLGIGRARFSRLAGDGGRDGRALIDHLLGWWSLRKEGRMRRMRRHGGLRNRWTRLRA